MRNELNNQCSLLCGTMFVGKSHHKECPYFKVEDSEQSKGGSDE